MGKIDKIELWPLFGGWSNSILRNSMAIMGISMYINPYENALMTIYFNF